MAWNEPGGPRGRAPWGQRPRGDRGPPDLDEIYRKLQRKLRSVIGGRGRPGRGGSLRTALPFLAAILIALWMLSGFYVVDAGERAAVLRFGKLTEIARGGLHWHIPYPVDRVDRVNVEKVYLVEVGYRSAPAAAGQTHTPNVALMLTQDDNIVDVAFSIQYQITNAADYLFNVKDPEATVRQAAEAVVHEVVGQRGFDDIAANRQAIEGETQGLLQRILNGYQAGITIQGVEMQRPQPPAQVQSAFDGVDKARADAERMKTEAQAYAQDLLPRTRGEASRLVQEAQAYKASVIARAEGDSERFLEIARQYVKAPAVTRERLYLETMQQVMSDTTKVFVDQRRGGNVIYLPLGELMRRAEGESAPAAPAPAPKPPKAPLTNGQDQDQTRGGLRGRGMQ